MNISLDIYFFVVQTDKVNIEQREHESIKATNIFFLDQ